MSEIKLENCPFCGGEGEVVAEWLSGGAVWQARCKDEIACKVPPTSKGCMTQAKAVEVWNQRAAPKPDWRYVEDGLPTEGGEYWVTYICNDALYTRQQDWRDDWDGELAKFHWKHVTAYIRLPEPAEVK